MCVCSVPLAAPLRFLPAPNPACLANIVCYMRPPLPPPAAYFVFLGMLAVVACIAPQLAGLVPAWWSEHEIEIRVPKLPVLLKVSACGCDPPQGREERLGKGCGRIPSGLVGSPAGPHPRSLVAPCCLETHACHRAVQLLPA